MARKPLIAPGSLLPGKEPPSPDLLQRVIERDREHRRKPENTEISEHMTGHTVIQSYSHTNASQSDFPEEYTTFLEKGTQKPEPMGSGLPNNRMTGHTVIRSLQESISSRTMVEAIERIKSRVAGRTKTVTFKVDIGLDDHVSAWVAEGWRERRQKQDVLRRALMLWMYEQETGQQLVDFGDEEG